MPDRRGNWSIALVRHGATEWTATGQHTGATDIPLSDVGVKQAQCLGRHFARTFHGDLTRQYAYAFVSPKERAKQTCDVVLKLAGGKTLKVIEDRDLAEWNYGEYEGLTSAEIRKRDPAGEDWNVFIHGCPGGETAADVGKRVDRFLQRARELALSLDNPKNILAFSHGHVLRVLGARWIGLPPDHGRFLAYNTAAVSYLAFEHNNLNEPVLQEWNSVTHLVVEDCLQHEFECSF
ncbi:uncharacterized protein SPPG_07656 [Spizellomyces punctatus DAOM BR117]|uniref:Phosphoglycerate mutase n=1 Tax=Spizellomyces punctatus (strain DAOM BR117) TaxID=645134 RepID=A0A0L0H6G3_SPIPD|nr:uncharacterized protein SPPG_07656 [Spizellomyces punctatus DAOM BR117]KNC96822.1 hypothetical protein SPPG_07656 [Spizellomyces punctatus DAOM BR117]|eukprot:XP_016604862.1 hypothetical protein SPPG_07656 [Spizellomyces punctatus DAOM BR117]